MMGNGSAGPHRHLSGVRCAVGVGEDGRRAVGAGMRGMELYWTDWLAAHDEPVTLILQLAGLAHPMSAMRAVQFAGRSEVEPQGYYRRDPASGAGRMSSPGAIGDDPVRHRR